MTHKDWDMRHSMLCLGEEEAGSMAEEEDAFREGAGDEAIREQRPNQGCSYQVRSMGPPWKPCRVLQPGTEVCVFKC